jgi:hypothetical protein
MTEPITTPAVEATKVAELPDWAQKHISDLRAENAAARVKATEAKDTAVAAVNAEWDGKVKALETEKAELTSAATQLDLNLTKYKTAVKVGVPGEQIETFAGLLQGSTAAEIETHATTVRALLGTAAPVAATDPTAGRGRTPAPSAEDAFGAAIAAQLTQR